MPEKNSSWGRRIRKAGDYIKGGDWTGRRQEAMQFLVWKGIIRTPRQSGAPSSSLSPVLDSDRLRSEAHFWAQVDWDRVRCPDWGSIRCFGPRALLEMTQGRTHDINELIAETMQAPRHRGLRGLVLGCGDMMTEHTTFVNPYLSFAEIDAYDINEQAFEQARTVTAEAGLNVDFKVGDINRLVLPTNTYHLIIVFHSYHHFEQVEPIARQINQALVLGGVFYIFDYIGPRKLQQTKRQLFYAQLMLEALPERYRREINGQIRQQVRNVPPGTLSPDEAIRSDRILISLQRHLRIVWQYNWAGLLYPLLQGIAFNFDEEDSSDRALIDYLFNLDKVLCQSGRIEPNFTITLATKKQGTGGRSISGVHQQ